VAALATAPLRADASYFHFPAWVEICRGRHGIVVPPDLAESYFDSLSRLPGLVAQASARRWEPGFLACALSAIAASKGQHAVAEAVLELSSPEIAEKFLEWFFDQ